MSRIDEIVDQMQRSPQAIRFVDLCRVCDLFLDNRVNAVQVIGFISRRGKVIRGLISRTPKEWPRHIRYAKS
jgi:hypothetical protein